MKIHPPKLTIDPKQPFKDALFSRKQFADSLTNLLQKASEGLVILVHAPWGAGKTTFSEMWRTDLAIRGHEVAYFNAYSADHFEDPFVCFSGEIIQLADKKLGEGKGSVERRDFRIKVAKLGKGLAGAAAKAMVKIGTAGVMDEVTIDAVKGALSEVGKDAGDIASELIQRRIDSYLTEKESLKEFKKTLHTLAALIREEQNFPLTIIVDELDRCRPEFALALLERIKHLFDVDGVAFVLLVNHDQIESYIKTIYGEVNATAFLQKFATVFVELPHRGSEHQFEYENGRREYCRTLFAHHELPKYVARDVGFVQNCVEALAEHFQLTLREIEKAFTILLLYYASQPSNDFTNGFLVVMLSVLKVKAPHLYYQLAARNISHQEFLNETKLDRLKTSSPSPEWIKEILSVCLMSDEEYQKTRGADNQPRSLHLGAALLQDPRTTIPYLCGRLGRFSLKP